MRLPRIYDQTLRDGLSDYPRVSNDVKIELVDRLLKAGLDYFEVVRFPIDGTYDQFEEGVALLDRLQPYLDSGATIAAFAMGEAGIDEALIHADKFHELHVPSFACDAYAIYATGEREWRIQLDRLARARARCEDAGVRLTVGLGTSFGCPLTPDYSPEEVASRFRDIVALDVPTVMLGDTAGTGTPSKVRRLLRLVAEGPRPEVVRVHFHDTFGRALLNSWTAIEEGVDGVDGSLLGLGGEKHPYFIDADRINNGDCSTEAIIQLIIDAIPDAEESLQVPSIIELNATSRWLVPHVQGDVFGRSAFAELVSIEGDDEVQSGTNRH